MNTTFQGALQIDNSLSEIAANNSQIEALYNLGAAALNGSPTETFQVAAASGGPYAPQTLQVQNNSFNYGMDTGTLNAYVVALDPPITEYAPGLLVTFNPMTANTGSSTLNAGASAATIAMNGNNLEGGEIKANRSVMVQWDAGAANWHLVRSNGTFIVGPAQYQYQAPQWQQILAGNNAYWHEMGYALGTTYTNSSGKPISVSVYADVGASGFFQFYVNGTIVGISCQNGTGGPAYNGGNFTVPAGATYGATLAGTTTYTSLAWFDLY